MPGAITPDPFVAMPSPTGRAWIIEDRRQPRGLRQPWPLVPWTGSTAPWSGTAEEAVAYATRLNERAE